MTVKELREGLELLKDCPDNKIVHPVEGFDGMYFILEDKLDCAVGREIIKIG